MKTVSPSSITAMFAPSKCELRTWLRANTEVEEAPPSSFQVFLANQGIRHEIRVLEELKAEEGLANMGAVRKGNRLSVQPVSAEEWKIVCDLGGL